MENQNLSAREVAEIYCDANASERVEIIAHVTARAKVSKRARWGNMLKAMQAGDIARVRYYAATGPAKRELLKAINAAAKPTTPAKKTTARKTTTRKAPAKKTTTRKAPAKRTQPKPAPVTDLSALAAQAAQLDDAQFANFLNGLMVARKRG